MISPPTSISGLEAQLRVVGGVNAPSQKSLEAAESFNAFMIEQMLNTVTKAKKSSSEHSLAMEQMEYMRNKQFSDAIAKGADELKLRVAREIER